MRSCEIKGGGLHDVTLSLGLGVGLMDRESQGGEGNI